MNVKRLITLLSDNTPLILTAIGVAGTISTAILAGRASYRAAEVLRSDEEVEEVTAKVYIQKTWMLYIPAIGVGALTIASVVGASRISSRRAAALAMAYSLSESALEEYKTKVIERLGVNKERALRDDLAQEKITANPVGNQQVIITGSGDVLCFDMYTGRYFTSNMETLKKAQNDLNYTINNDFYASLNDFYDKIGLSRVTTGDEVGWNSSKLMELSFSTTISDDQRPCLAIDFDVSPVRNYYKVM